jgi:clan AA aspartic protease
MISGLVNARLEAVVRLRLRNASGTEREVEAVVDSGYTASLVLPPAVPAALGLVRRSGGRATLADGTIQQLDIYEVEVEWDGEWQYMLASAIGDTALVGMRLLVGHELRMAVVPGGAVEITQLP